MLICLATETATSNLIPVLLNAVIAICSLVIGWFLKVLSDSKSQMMLFDHRLRLEKEYGLYSDLWDKLFELRRAVGDLIASLRTTNTVRHSEQLPELFNAYQQVVHKGEPFMSPSIYGPAREVVTLVRTIIDNVKDQQHIKNRREKEPSAAADKKCADELIRLNKENKSAFRSIEDLYQQIAKVIRHRVTL